MSVFYKFKRITIYFVAKVKEKTMANKNIWLGILVMVLVFSMAVVGCNNDSTNNNNNNNNNGNGNSNGGIFTLTGIPSKYNGMYVYVEIDIEEEEIGDVIGGYDPSTDEITGGPISNGRVDVPIWIDDNDYELVNRYNGNHTAYYVEITIHEEKNSDGEIAELDYSGSVKFTNGSATMNWSAFRVSE